MQQWQVSDVMTRDVVTAEVDAPVGRIADLLATHRISAVPIVDDDGRVLGLVSEADLLPKVAGASSGGWRHRGSDRAAATSARQVMSTRPMTVPADTSLAEAAEKMQSSNVKRLLVTDDDGRVQGIVSRADVLRPLARPDADIRRDVVEDVLRRTLWIDPDEVNVDVRGGVVRLTGAVDRRTTAAMVARVAGRVPGVAGVVNRIEYDVDDTEQARSRVGRTHPFSAEPFHPQRPAQLVA